MSAPSLPEDRESWHLPYLRDFDSVMDLFSLINTILLMPAYDRRMYPSVEGRAEPGQELSRGDSMLYQLARQLALRVGNWFFSKYQLLAAGRTRILGGRDDFWCVSLLHSANMLVRYNSRAERNLIPTTHTTDQVRKQLRYCLQPFEQEIQDYLSLPTSSPEDMVLFLDPEKLKEILDKDDKLSAQLPLLLFRTSPDVDRANLPTLHGRLY